MSRDRKANSPNTTPVRLGDFLEFEKPLLRIHHDIEEMQREHRNTGHDLSTDIEQQRNVSPVR